MANSYRTLLVYLCGAICIIATAAAATGSIITGGSSVVWHSANMERVDTDVVKPVGARLGSLAYDNHFLNFGRSPEWGFLTRLTEPDETTARLEEGALIFARTAGSVVPDPTTLPDTASPSEPFLLEAPGVDQVLLVEPYYQFSSKAAAYRLTTYRDDGQPRFQFDTLPTHALSDAPNILVSPERAGCCDNMTWAIRFYDLENGNVTTFDCPPGRCGDMVLTRAGKDGTLFVALEVFETDPGVGSIVETRLFFVAPNGTPQAAGKLVHARHDKSVGVSSHWGICASRVLAAKASPYAAARLTAVRKLDDGRWAVRFDGPMATETWAVRGVSQERPPRLLAASAS